MKKKKILKCIGIIILLLVICFLGNAFRKMMILKELSQKQNEYDGKFENYHQKIVIDKDTSNTVVEHYSKGSKSITFINSMIKATGETEEKIMYSDENGTKIYREKGKENLHEAELVGFSSMPIGFEFEEINLWQFLQVTNEWSIQKDNWKEKECYVINHKNWKELENKDVYVEKQTGLAVKIGNYEYEYEFNEVDDSIFSEPDLEKYEIIEN